MKLIEIINEYLPSDGTKPTENKRMEMYDNINTFIQNQNQLFNNPIELVKCDSCDGVGEKYDYDERMCYKCEGTGEINKKDLFENM